EPDFPSADIARQRDSYTEQMTNAHQFALENLTNIKDTMNQEPNESGDRSRFAEEIDTIIETLEESLVNRPLTIEEYRKGIEEETLTDDSDIFLFLSAKQARQFLQNGRPRVTILVPASLDPNARPPMDLDVTLKKLAAYSTINYHDVIQPQTKGR